MIPQSMIDTVLMRTDIVDLIGQYVSLKKEARALLPAARFTRKKPLLFTYTQKSNFITALAAAHMAMPSDFSWLMNA